MTSIPPRVPRIIPGFAPDDSPSPGARRFDYAALAMRREPLRLRPRAGAGELAQAAAPDADSGAGASWLAPHDDGAARADDAERDVWPGRVEHAAARVVSAVFLRQQQGLRILGVLTQEIGAFCGDPAIAAAGNWEAQLTLDPALLPHTKLTLTLSRFSLHLRFDAQDPGARDLLLAHSTMLERELAATLHAWGEDRDIELTVW